MEISIRIANLLKGIAHAEGRSEEEVLNDALALYQGRAPKPHSQEQFAEFRAFLDRISSRFDLEGEDEAMRAAIEEQNAFRRERSESERTGR